MVPKLKKLADQIIKTQRGTCGSDLEIWSLRIPYKLKFVQKNNKTILLDGKWCLSVDF